MQVTIKPELVETITYGDPLPEINFDYIFGTVDETAVVDGEVASTFAANHVNALSLVNGFSLVNGLSLVDGISLVDGEPYINGISLVNKTFFVSQSTADNSKTVEFNGFSLVNGAQATSKLVNFEAGLFSDEAIEMDMYSSINGISLVDGLSLVNGLVNGIALVDGISLVNGISLVDGISLVNGLSLVDGLSLVNGDASVNGIALVNSAGDPVFNDNDFASFLVILNEADPLSTDPIAIIPTNVLTGVDVGTQYVIPGGLLDTNFEIRYEPTPLEILSADLTVTPVDATITYGDDLAELTGIIGDDDLKYNDTFEDVFPDGIIYSLDCTQCGVLNSPYLIQASATNTSSNYNVTFVDTGVLNVNKFELTITANDASITYGQADLPAFSVSSSPETLPYNETVAGILGDLSFTPSDGCTQSSAIMVSPEIQPDNYNITW